MNQEITYSDKLFSFMYEDSSPFELTPQKAVWQIIKQNYIVVDKKKRLLEKYAKAVLSLPDSDRKSVLKTFVDGLVNKKGNLLKEFGIESKENLEIALSLFSKDKIYFIPKMNEEVRLNSIENPYLEVHDCKSFINPSQDHKLKNLPTFITLQVSKRYHIRNIITPFFRSAKSIQIDDPYLPNINASINFFKIVKSFKGIQTKLIFMNKKDYLNASKEDFKRRADRYDSFIKKLKKLNSFGYSIDFKDQFGKGHTDRYIFIDSLQAYLPGGFDCLDKYGFVLKNIGKKEIRIEKR